MATPNDDEAEASKPSVLVLTAEELMLQDGYAAVTYRNVAAKAGVAVGTLQYYFPTVDSLFAAVLHQYSERSFRTLQTALEDNPDDVLGILWDYSSDEVSTALLMEFMALANRRKSIHVEIAAFAAQYRKVQFDALTKNWDKLDLSIFGDNVTPEVIALLITCLPKWMRLENSFGLAAGHDQIRTLADSYRSRARSALDASTQR